MRWVFSILHGSSNDYNYGIARGFVLLLVLVIALHHIVYFYIYGDNFLQDFFFCVALV